MILSMLTRVMTRSLTGQGRIPLSAVVVRTIYGVTKMMITWTEAETGIRCVAVSVTIR